MVFKTGGIGVVLNRQSLNPLALPLFALLILASQLSFLYVNAGYDRISVTVHEIEHNQPVTFEHGHEIALDLVIVSVNDSNLDHDHSPKVSFDLSESFFVDALHPHVRLEPFKSCFDALESQCRPPLKPPRAFI